MSNSNTDNAPNKRGRPPKAKNLVIEDTVSFSSSGESSGRHHKTPVVATVVENSSKKRTASSPPKLEPSALNTSKWLLRTLGGGGSEKKMKTMEPVPDTQFSQDDGEEEEEMKFTLPVLPHHPLLQSSMTMATPPKVARVTSSKITGLVCTKVWLTDVITVTSSLASETHSAYIDNTAPLIDNGGGGGGGGGKPRELWQMAWDATVTKRRGPYGDGLVLHQAHFRVRQHLHDESGGNKAFDFAPTFIVLQNVVTKHEFLLDSKFFGSWISV